MGILIFIISLALLVLIHEFGHFIVAKKMGVKVEEFGIGFPPRIFGKKFGETLYSINLLPIGGFVKVYGEEYHEDTGDINKEDKKRAFVYIHPWKKSAILLAGVFMNFMLGWFIVSYLFTQGVPTPVDKVIVEEVQPNSPAALAGLQKDDVLVSLNSISLKTSEDLVKATKEYGDTSALLTYTRNETQQVVEITPRKNPPPNEGSLGIVITNYVVQKYPWYTAPYYGLKHAAVVTTSIFKELGKTLLSIASFQGAKLDVMGPVGIAQYTEKAYQFGWNAVFELVALLSLNLAVVNLLPFPALDGGRLVFVIYEWVTRKRIPAKFEQYMNLFGMVTLLGLSVIITYFDIMKIFK